MRLLFTLLLFTALSCEKFEENPVYGQVYLTLFLSDRDKVLQDIPSYKTFTRPGIDYRPQFRESVGMGGILVVHTPPGGKYCAFDLACPNEPSPSRNTIVEVDKNGMNAICPKCGTKYEIMIGTGLALEGKKHGLRMYNVSVSGNSGVVSN